MFDYVSNPEEIYRQSFQKVGQLISFGDVCKENTNIVIRLIHSCGMIDILNDLKFSEGAVQAGMMALQQKCDIFVDSEMVSAGIIKDQLLYKNPVKCTLNQPSVLEESKKRGITRSAVAVELWQPHLEGAIVVFGNAPTALFRFLEILNQGGPLPSLILGFPVGFVGAAESKEALCKYSCKVPYITLLGKRGGSALAAAAVNALNGECY